MGTYDELPQQPRTPSNRMFPVSFWVSLMISLALAALRMIVKDDPGPWPTILLVGSGLSGAVAMVQVVLARVKIQRLLGSELKATFAGVMWGLESGLCFSAYGTERCLAVCEFFNHSTTIRGLTADVEIVQRNTQIAHLRFACWLGTAKQAITLKRGGFCKLVIVHWRGYARFATPENAGDNIRDTFLDDGNYTVWVALKKGDRELYRVPLDLVVNQTLPDLSDRVVLKTRGSS